MVFPNLDVSRACQYSLGFFLRADSNEGGAFETANKLELLNIIQDRFQAYLKFKVIGWHVLDLRRIRRHCCVWVAICFGGWAGERGGSAKDSATRRVGIHA
jgi:hypothetical protein